LGTDAAAVGAVPAAVAVPVGPVPVGPVPAEAADPVPGAVAGVVPGVVTGTVAGAVADAVAGADDAGGVAAVVVDAADVAP
jgi:hypothetical protein